MPDGGGPLAAYLSSVEREIGWIPEANSPIGRDLAEVLEFDNDPAAWVGFAARTLYDVWESLPAEIRQEAQTALLQLAQEGINALGDVAQLAVSSALSNIADVLPFIGAIIDALLVVINKIIEFHKEMESEKEDMAALEHYGAVLNTIRQNEAADSSKDIAQRAAADALVFARDRVENYLDYSDSEWRKRPCFTRSSGAADLMFVSSSGPSDSGYCTKGLRYNCPLIAPFMESDCSIDPKSGSSSDLCERYLGISALFFPFWSPAYPDIPYITIRPVKGVDFSDVNGNTVLAEQQFALLSSPSVNLRVDAQRLLDIRDRFREFFFNQAKMYAPSGHDFGLLQIDEDGIAPGTAVKDRITIDAAPEKEYLPTVDRKDLLYIDRDGLIRIYEGAQVPVDLNKWGIRAKRGPQSPTNVAISVAQYNTVVGATLAFMSARANFLRNGLMMKALLQDNGPGAFDPAVRDAMEYAASIGATIPLPQLPARATPDWQGPGGTGRFDVKGLPPKRAGRKSKKGGGQGAGIALAIIAVVALAAKK